MPATEGESRGLSKPVFLTALRLLAAKRLTKAQLTKKLRDRGFAADVAREAVEECERRKYLDDRTFAQLFVSNALERKPVGRMRLLRDLIKQGIESELAREIVAETEAGEDERLDQAIRKLEASRPGERFDRLARRLVNMGFAAPSIARALRRRSESRAPLGELKELR
jgi:regulatory protein